MKLFGIETLFLASTFCFAAFAPQFAAQRSASAATPTVQVDPAKAADVLISTADKDFLSLIEAMPEDKFDFAPSPSLFKNEKGAFDGVRKFPQLATHTIEANYFFWSAASGLRPDVDSAAIGKLKSKGEILAAAKGFYGVRAQGRVNPNRDERLRLRFK